MIGKKGESLIKLREAGFKVPPFLLIESEDVAKLFVDGKIDKEAVGKMAEKIRRDLVKEFYVIRSAALIEDGREQSMAGQFSTVINKSPFQIESAIESVVTQAYEYLNGEIEKFSLIAQEYIAADFSGVAFSRSPLGGREMVIEYHRGIGEELVGGEIRPLKIRSYWNHKIDSSDLKEAEILADGVKKIETIFGFPQDVEWCVKDGELYYLQSRPITTLSEQQFSNHKFLDSELPQNEEFIFEETEISEIAPRPCELTLSLLKMLYQNDGTVEKVYGKYGITYTNNDFLKIIGNELFVDREKEIKSLFPAYSYLGRKVFEPHLAGFGGLFRTWKNIWKLNRLSLLSYPELRDKLRDCLRTKLPSEATFAERLNHFMKEYELIFEINLFAAKAFKTLESNLRNEKISVAEILACSFDTDYEELIYFDDAGLTGNGLNIADDEDFIFTEMNTALSEDLERWYEGLSNLRKDLYLPQILQGQRFNRLREYARWLTVKNINYLRDGLPKEDEIYFATIEEIVSGNIDQVKISDRRKKYNEGMQHDFPARILSRPEGVERRLSGVSGGKAEGKLLPVDQLEDGAILYTPVLSPSLFKYFPKIKGILAEQGGMLSHLAIIAREKKIPVVVGFDFANSKIEFGDSVEIDGSNGEVREISELE